MKRLENLLLKACGLATAILTLFYLFAALNTNTDAAISFSTFALIFGFGFLISVATMIFEIKSLNLAIRFIIHYSTLMVAFCVVFISTGNIATDSSSKIFTAVVLFTIFYALFFALSYAIKRIVNLIDVKTDKHINSKNKTKPRAEEKKPYKSLYSDK